MHAADAFGAADAYVSLDMEMPVLLKVILIVLGSSICGFGIYFCVNRLLANPERGIFVGGGGVKRWRFYYKHASWPFLRAKFEENRLTVSAPFLGHFIITDDDKSQYIIEVVDDGRKYYVINREKNQEELEFFIIGQNKFNEWLIKTFGNWV